MSEIKITQLKPELASQIRDFVYSVLDSVGVMRDKYPIIKKETGLDYIHKVYRGRSRFWLALSDSKIIATIAIEEINKKEAELKRMLILPEFQRQGLGQKLLNTALNFSEKNGYKKVILYTDRVMKGAQSFYEKNGFHKTEESKEWFRYDLDL